MKEWQLSTLCSAPIAAVTDPSAEVQEPQLRGSSAKEVPGQIPDPTVQSKRGSLGFVAGKWHALRCKPTDAVVESVSLEIGFSLGATQTGLHES